MAHEDKIRSFITTNFYVAEPDKLDVGASLLDSGIVDSTGILEVVSFLESEFGIQVADEDMIPDNLDSIARIAAFVTRKKAA